MPDPFVSTQDLVDYLGRGTATDPGMLIAVDAACDMVRTLAEQSFNAGTATQTLDGTDTDALILRERPVGTVTAVSVAGSAVTDYVYTDDGLLFRQDDYGTLTWPEGRRNVEVTYEYGYADDDLPRDVRMVALAIATRIVVQGAAAEESVGESRVKYATNSTDLTSGEKMILRKYKRLA
ncbi:MAG TPA: hypothetical protein VM493_09580 [Vicinamibacterales bacterium]|nr:hypothetical protein [Vicinamibacterales bacterium]